MQNAIFITPAEFESLLDLSHNDPGSDFVGLCAFKFTSLDDLLEIASDYQCQSLVVFYGGEYLIALEDDFYLLLDTDAEKKEVHDYITLLNAKYL